VEIKLQETAAAMTGKRKVDSPLKKPGKRVNWVPEQVEWKMLNLPITNPMPNPVLEAHLKKMQLDELLHKPWSVKINSVVQDFYSERERPTEEAFRGNLKRWTTHFVGKVYKIPTVGEENWLKEEVAWEEYFDVDRCDPKISWKVEHCLDSELRELFSFLLPIFYPSKPHRITKGFATTVIWALKFGKQVNWSAIFVRNLHKMVQTLHSERFTYLCPFVAHGYCYEEVFTPAEESEYTKAESDWIFKLGTIKPETVEIEDSEDDLEPIPEIPLLEVKQEEKPRVRQSKRATRGDKDKGKSAKEPEMPKGDKSFQESYLLCSRGMKEMNEIHQALQESVLQVCKVLNCQADELLEIAAEGANVKQIKEELAEVKAQKKELQADKQRMNEKFRKLSAEFAAGKEKLKSREQIDQGVITMLQEMEHFLTLEPEVATKAYLVQEMLEKNGGGIEAQKVQGLLQYYKDKNYKAYHDSRKVCEELKHVQQHLSYERRLAAKLVTGPAIDFKLMLPELAVLTPETKERTEWYITATSSYLPAFPDFFTYCNFLKARLYALFELPSSSEALAPEYLADLFKSMEAISTRIFRKCEESMGRKQAGTSPGNN
jgi:hypothetical protein